jgi:hypothetical protein
VTVYAPNITSYTSRIPYITSAEYKASATGVNVSQLVPRGTPEENADALEIAIRRASSFVDTHCRQVLAATSDIQSGRYRINRSGFVQIPTDYSPIIAVNSIELGFAPSAMSTFTDMTNLWIDRKVVTVPLQTVQLLPLFSAMYSDGRVYAKLNYVNGYACTLTDTTSVAGASSLVLDSMLGVQPGVQLTIYDPGRSEVVYVQSVSGNTVTLSAPMTYAHGTGVSVSSLPAAVKQATVLLTSALIKTRGSEAIVMNSMSAPPSRTTATEDGGMQEIALARELLKPFARVV